MTEGTTHAGWGAGRPRLVTTGQYKDHFEFPLTTDLVRIGSASENEIVLPGTDSVHAQIVHDDFDEYELTLLGKGTMNAVSISDESRTEVLRHGAIFTIGDHTLVFMRDEYADHGAPFGGRQGGEGAHQHGQPPRPDYRKERDHEQERKPGKHVQ